MEAFHKTSGITLRCTETFFECPLCMDRFESPRILPCQHTFCQECLTQLITKNCLDSSGRVNKKSFPCPICRRIIKLFKHEGVVSMDDHLKGFPEHRLLVDLISKENIINKSAAKYVEAESQTDYHINESIPDNEDTEYLIHKTLSHYYIFLCTIYQYLGYCTFLKNGICCKIASRDMFLNPRLNATFAFKLRRNICFLRFPRLDLSCFNATIPLHVFPEPAEFIMLNIKNKWQHVEKLQFILELLIDSSGLDDVIKSEWHEQLESQMNTYQWYENTRDVATQTEEPKSIIGMIRTFIGHLCMFVPSQLLLTGIISIVVTGCCMIAANW